MRALFVVNRFSRLGDADLSLCIEELERHGFSIDQGLVDRPDQIPAVIRDQGQSADVIVLAGGDGTMNIAAEALVELKRPLGIVPTGTGNDLARTLGIPVDAREAIGVIAGGLRQAIDVGRVNDKLFFNVASIGLSAELIRHHSDERKRRFWLFAYVLSVIDAYRSTRPFRAFLRCDGEMQRLRALQISIGNGRHYGGGMTIHEGATIDDQRFDVYVLRPLGFWRLLMLFPALRWGRLEKLDDILVRQAREIELRTRRAMPINTDGEITTRTPARFTVLPQAIQVFVPESYIREREQIGHAAQ
jgi:diacylglycerol kinase (ATP)